MKSQRPISRGWNWKIIGVVQKSPCRSSDMVYNDQSTYHKFILYRWSTLKAEKVLHSLEITILETSPNEKNSKVCISLYQALTQCTKSGKIYVLDDTVFRETCQPAYKSCINGSGGDNICLLPFNRMTGTAQRLLLWWWKKSTPYHGSGRYHVETTWPWYKRNVLLSTVPNTITSKWYDVGMREQ